MSSKVDFKCGFGTREAGCMYKVCAARRIHFQTCHAEVHHSKGDRKRLGTMRRSVSVKARYTR